MVAASQSVLLVKTPDPPLPKKGLGNQFQSQGYDMEERQGGQKSLLARKRKVRASASEHVKLVPS